MSVTRRTWAEISLNSIENNFISIKNHAENTPVCCVIKADGYGHGAEELAEVYTSLGAEYFAVSNIDEAKDLRNHGITLPIVILGYTNVNDAERLSRYNLDQTVYSYEYARALNEQCAKSGVKVNIHIKVDTGMSRIGFMCQEFPRDNNSIKEINEACNLEYLTPVGIFTHFCVSDEGDDGKSFTEKQLSNFLNTVSILKEQNIEFKYVHCANSGAIEDYSHAYKTDLYKTMVRAGIILYGLSPSDKIKNPIDITPAMTLKTVISHVKTVEQGATVSYGRTFTAENRMKIATVPIGYADGYIRAYSKGYMIVNGKKAKILGRICMDQTMLDVTNIENVSIGDEVIVFGSGANGEQTADDLAKMADTINYEVVCNISKRVPRYYIRDGKTMKVMYKL